MTDKVRARRSGNMLWWSKTKLKSQDVDTRKQAVRDLSRIEGSGAAECLIEALADADWGVQELAARALIARGDPRALSFLIKMLGTRVGPQAEELLVALEDQAIGAPSSAPPRARTCH